MNHRPEIAGLRAVSVGAVVAYHYGFAGLPGGFVGVDVFFVISGYLISRQIIDQIEGGRFSLLDFYDRRVRRIVPAAVVVLLATLIAGYVFLYPGDYQTLGDSAAWAAAFLSNIYFFNNTGYFDQTAEMQPLLHFWSLAVEEQFYVVWPLLLFGITLVARSRSAIGAVVLAVTLASFSASVFAVAEDPKAAFYLPHLRAWELAIGGVVAIGSSAIIRSRVLAWACDGTGIVLIAASILLLSAESSFPGLAALAPCLGAALLLWPKDVHTPVSTALSLRPMHVVGDISYSLYLWHWPIIVFARHYLHGEMPSTLFALGLVAFAVALSWLSWRFVEQPLRRPWLRPGRTVALGLVGTASVVIVGFGLVQSGGAPWRLSPQVAAMGDRVEMWNWPCPMLDLGRTESYCQLGDDWESAPTKGFLWGDSHAEAIAPIVDLSAARNDASVVLYGECPAVLGAAQVHRYRPNRPAYRDECQASHDEAVAYLQSHPDVNLVILNASWTSILDDLVQGEATESSRDEALRLIEVGLLDLVGRISAPNRRIVLMGDVPHWAADKDSPTEPLSCALAEQSSILRARCDPGQLAVSRAGYEAYDGAVLRVFEQVAERLDDVDFVSLGHGMCAGRAECVSFLNGEFLYRDRGHLRRNLSPETVSQLTDVVGFDRVFDRDAALVSQD
jgi:peptidoglycan/LPS O-acetylase OafA/YrhL